MNEIFCEDVDHITKTGLVADYPIIISGFLLGTDSANDPTIAGWNNGDQGKLVFPSATYDASALGLNGYQGKWRYSEGGLYLKVTCAGSFYIVPSMRKWFSGSGRR